MGWTSFSIVVQAIRPDTMMKTISRLAATALRTHHEIKAPMNYPALN